MTAPDTGANNGSGNGPHAGPLSGFTIVELAGLGALPFGTLKLADLGADVIRVHRASEVPGETPPARESEWDRGRRSIAVDLKHPDGVETVLRLVERADAFCEAFRPGVAERLGLGPEVVGARNPRIVYGRLTGWGQDGPLANSAGHSLNYEAITGAIGSIGGRDGRPVPLLQVLGDFAGGGLLLAFGLVCALLEAQRSGVGQVVDAAMVDGVMSLYTPFYGMAESGMHTEQIGANLFDGGAPFYDVYETADAKWITLAPIEPQFFAQMVERLGLTDLPAQWDTARWPETRERIAAVVRTRTRDAWEAELAGTDVCFAPVYRLGEAHTHPHHIARSSFLTTESGRRQVAPSPRFSRTPGAARPAYAFPGSDTDAVLTDAGFTPDEITALRASGAINGR